MNYSLSKSDKSVISKSITKIKWFFSELYFAPPQYTRIFFTLASNARYSVLDRENAVRWSWTYISRKACVGYRCYYRKMSQSEMVQRKCCLPWPYRTGKPIERWSWFNWQPWHHYCSNLHRRIYFLCEILLIEFLAFFVLFLHPIMCIALAIKCLLNAFMKNTMKNIVCF